MATETGGSPVISHWAWDGAKLVLPHLYAAEAAPGGWNTWAFVSGHAEFLQSQSLGLTKDTKKGRKHMCPLRPLTFILVSNKMLFYCLTPYKHLCPSLDSFSMARHLYPYSSC